MCAVFVRTVDRLKSWCMLAAIVGGILATTACVSQADPALAWSFGIIAGGGAAAVVQSGTVLARGTFTATTGGMGNFLVAGGELVGATVTSILAIVAPLLACLLFAVFAAVTALLFVRWRKRRMASVAFADASRNWRRDLPCDPKISGDFCRSFGREAVRFVRFHPLLGYRKRLDRV